MRILMLTQWFTPEPIFKGLPFAKELIRRGHEVEVLTGIPNYPGGKVYDGYRIHFYQRETMDGVPVIRVPLYPSHDSSAIRRIANYASFSVAAATIGLLSVRKADVMYVYHPPATVGLPAVLIKLLRRIPFVYDIQDLWPDTLAATGMLDNKLALKMVDSWCRFIYRRASRIVVLSPGFKDVLVEKGVPAEKVEVVYNWCDESTPLMGQKDESLARELGFANRFNIVFAGTMGKAQALDSVLDAAAMIAEKYPTLQFIFIGGGIEVDRLKERTRVERLTNVKFLPRRSMSEIGPILQVADALLVHLKDHPLFRITVPSKTQAYLAAGRPILMGVAGDAHDLCKKSGAGLSFLPENSESLAKAVIDLYCLPQKQRDIMGAKGREFYLNELSLGTGAERFEEIFRAVTRLRRGGGA